jgi:hypothetical protein
MARNRRKTAQTLEKFLLYPQVTGASTRTLRAERFMTDGMHIIIAGGAFCAGRDDVRAFVPRSLGSSQALLLLSRP